ncbi:predicted protein [Histoplasma capsulatum var. duboisii H88]|uniref:Predicted protein n=2 Tax=Ajellomyces capsulatus TaxID=5037 RepID=F0UL78_AJEC8|nr:predicted protein [Histoplasma capsulatum H143]EGC46182.1 predicted protein [Histoplasma capsulatum var. duboisii H88]
MAGLIGSSHSASIVELQPAEYYSKNKATITNFELSFQFRTIPLRAEAFCSVTNSRCLTGTEVRTNEEESHHWQHRSFNPSSNPQRRLATAVTTSGERINVLTSRPGQWLKGYVHHDAEMSSEAGKSTGGSVERREREDNGPMIFVPQQLQVHMQVASPDGVIGMRDFNVRA